MSRTDLVALLPVVVVAAASVGVMLRIAYSRSHTITALLTAAGLGGSLSALFPAARMIPREVTPLLVIDGYALFFMGLIAMAGLVVAALSYGYLEGREEDPEEFYLLLLLAVLGSMVLVSARHFVSFFLGLEVLSVSLYAMVAYSRSAGRGIEAGLKYLVLAGVSSAFLLFGMALVYTGLGTMEFGQMAKKAMAAGGDPVLLAGFAMIIVGIGFKLALFPFHMWTPDVYEGAPAPVSAFVATVSKGAVFALLVRYFGGEGLKAGNPLFLTFSVLAVASMFAGNLLALFQDNVKRVLAYSSIAHLGYLLVAFLSGGMMMVPAVGYYLAAYFATMLGAFGVVTVISGKERDADTLEDYRGLAGERPWLAGIFAAMLLSLAGIPLTAGFIGKFYVVAAGVESALWVPVLALAVNSAIGLFYYLRIMAVMFVPVSDRGALPQVPLAGGVVVVCLTGVILWLGVFPAFLVDLIRAMTSL